MPNHLDSSTSTHESLAITRRPERLLVGDPAESEAATIRTALMESGFAVIGPATEGAQVIELARSMRPDMAVIDPMVPHDECVVGTLTKQLGIPVIVVTSAVHPEILRQTAALATYGYLLKPIAADALCAAIEVGWNRFLDYEDQQEEINRLKQRLEDRKTIEQAKWMLVERRHVSEPDAMRLLQRQARNNRRTLIDVARSLLENESLMDDDG